MSRPPSPPPGSEPPASGKEGDPPPEADPDVQEKASDKTVTKEKEVEPQFRRRFRTVTLVPKRQVVDVSVQGAAPPTTTFTEAVLFMIPRIACQSQSHTWDFKFFDADKRTDIMDGSEFYDKMVHPNWEIGLYDSSAAPAWNIWRVDLGERTAQKIQNPSVVDSGIVRGRVTTASARESLIGAISKYVAPCAKKAADSQNWVDLVVDKVHIALESDLELPTAESVVNDGAVMTGLFTERARTRVDTGQIVTLRYILSERPYALVDEHFLNLTTGCRSASATNPLCTLYLGPMRSTTEYDFVINAHRQTIESEPRDGIGTVDLFPSDMDGQEHLAVLLIATKNPPNSRERIPRSSLHWDIVLASFDFIRKEYSSTKVGLAIESASSSRLGVKVEICSWSDIETAQVGILIGYTQNKEEEEFIRALKHAVPRQDQLDWIKIALRNVINLKDNPILSPDRATLLTATWLKSFSSDLESALEQEISVLPEISENGRPMTIENHVARDCQLVDEQFLRLMRHCSRQGVGDNDTASLRDPRQTGMANRTKPAPVTAYDSSPYVTYSNSSHNRSGSMGPQDSLDWAKPWRKNIGYG